MADSPKVISTVIVQSIILFWVICDLSSNISFSLINRVNPLCKLVFHSVLEDNTSVSQQLMIGESTMMN